MLDMIHALLKEGDDVLVLGSIINLFSFPPRLNEPHLAEPSHVVGDCGFADADHLGQGAHLHLSMRQRRKDPDAAGIAEGAEQFRDMSGRVLIKDIRMGVHGHSLTSEYMFICSKNNDSYWLCQAPAHPAICLMAFSSRVGYNFPGMKLSQIIVFLVIVLLVYGSINFYILRRTRQALADSPVLRWVFFSLFLLLMLAYPAGRFLERGRGNSISAVVITIGAYYFALMIYLLLAACIIDLFRLGDKLFHFFPEAVRRDPHRSAELAFFVGVVAAFLTVILGHLNTLHPRFRKLDLKVDKPAGALQELRIALASDIHVGTVTGTETLERIIARLNSLKPDLVLLPGDVFDEDVSGARAQEVSCLLKSIRAPLGVFACTGNHDYYAGIERCLENLRLGGVTVLQDEAVQVAGSFYLLGRRDPASVRRGERRTPLKDIAAGCDRALPLVLLDHQPLRLEEAAQNGIDLQISGHTHAGQLFPLNLINQLVWKVYWGYSRKGRTQYYVSCGAGTWGPPVRTGSYPEIVQIRLTFAGGR